MVTDKFEMSDSSNTAWDSNQILVFLLRLNVNDLKRKIEIKIWERVIKRLCILQSILQMKVQIYTKHFFHNSSKNLLKDLKFCSLILIFFLNILNFRLKEIFNLQQFQTSLL